MPDCRIEVLIPDFQGNEAALRTVLDAGPDVLNHNTETVPRLYRMARSGGRYARTLELLDRSRRYAPTIPTKTGLMVGLGEEPDELLATFKDLRGVGCGILTIGQYLRPTDAHAPMVRYYHPDEFRDLKAAALEMGFVHVESGPLVRSSYHAHETADAYARASAHPELAAPTGVSFSAQPSSAEGCSRLKARNHGITTEDFRATIYAGQAFRPRRRAGPERSGLRRLQDEPL